MTIQRLDTPFIYDETNNRILGVRNSDHSVNYLHFVPPSMLDASGGPRRAVVGNRNHFPIYDQAEATNNVFNQRIRRVASSNATWTNIKLTYAGYLLQGSEVTMTSPFTMRAGIEYNGIFYPVTFGGARDWTFATPQSYKESDIVAGLTLPPGAVYYERVYRVLSTLSGNNILVSGTSDVAFGEWTYKGTNTAIDYTLGGEPGSGATAYFNITGTTINSFQVDNGGSGYVASPVNVYAFDPDKGLNTVTLIATRTVTAGSVVVGFQSGGLSNTTGWGLNTRAVILPTSGVTLATGHYFACLVTGTPDRVVNSLVINGDSNGCGYGSSDAIGDEARNFGIFERAWSNTVGIVNFSYPGLAVSTLATAGTFPLTRAMIEPVVTHAYVQAGGNDVGAGATAGIVINNKARAGALWTAKGIVAFYGSHFPRTTGTYTSAGGQTPVSGFAAGEAIDGISAAAKLKQGGLMGRIPPVDVRAAATDPANPNVWRSDGGVAYTTDGTHPSAAWGLARIAADLKVPFLG